MLHGSFSTDGLLVGQGGESLDLPGVIFVDVDSRQAQSAVHLGAPAALSKPLLDPPDVLL